MYANHPYTTGIAVRANKPITIIQGYVLTTPIRDRVPCHSGSTQSHVLLIGNEAQSAYLDLYVVAIQLALLITFLIVAPSLMIRKLKAKKIAAGSSIFGILFASLIIYATTNHLGWQLIVPSMILCVFILLLPSYWIYNRSSVLITSEDLDTNAKIQLTKVPKW